MNFSDYLKNVKTETNVNESTGGFFKIANTKEFRDYFKEITVYQTPEYYLNASGNDLEVIARDHEGALAFEIVAKLTDNLDVAKVECTPSSNKFSSKSLKGIAKFVSVNLELFVEDFEGVISKMKKYPKK